MDKKIVCYFSASGITKGVAEKIAKVIEGDLFEIEPTEKYTDADLDWTNKKSRSSVEMADENSRPGVKNKVEDIDSYNKVVLGFPVWWYKEPTIVDTFIEENNLENKEIYVFVTSGSSSVDGSLESLRNRYKNLNFVDGKRFSRNINSNEVLNWIK